MTEQTQITTNTNQVKVPSVFIDGDKSAFVSKAAVDKFKQAVKSTQSVNLSDLVNKYVKPEFSLELLSGEDGEWKFRVVTKQVVKQNKPQREKTESEQRRELLRAKLNLMASARTNKDYRKAKSAGNVDHEILVEYQKLIKMTKMPIPEPSEILAKPDEYRPIISAVLGNQMMKQQKSHPYVRYFTLIAEKLGIGSMVPMYEQSVQTAQQSLENLMKSSGPTEIKQVSGNNINNGDETDSEDESDNIDV